MKLITRLSKQFKVQFNPLTTGLNQGIDLGSRKFNSLELPKIALLTGDGISPYEAGEIWHLMDQRFQIPITKITTSNIDLKNLNRYSHIILVNDPKAAINTVELESLNKWIKTGGTLVVYGSAGQFLKRHNLLTVEILKSENIAENISFEQQSDYFGARRIGGAIFEAKIDRSHPINFGYAGSTIPLFRRNTLFIKPNKQSFNNPIRYTNNPLLSGYISNNNLEVIAGTVPFVNASLGKGRVVYFTDNTNFRGFWYGTNKLLMNAIYFSKSF